MKEKIFLYLLELENNKFYVGQTDNVDARFKEHVIGEGSKWTRLNKPIKIIKVRQIEISDTIEALLFENWMTLHYMEKYGWKNVRGGEFLFIEEYRLKEKIEYIFNTESNKIKYYIKSQYLFGVTTNWLIYVLEQENNKFYIGSTKRLGKSVGRHFNGSSVKWTKENKPVRIKELIIVKPTDGNYLDKKKTLLAEYISRYGRNNVLGGQEL